MYTQAELVTEEVSLPLLIALGNRFVAQACMRAKAHRVQTRAAESVGLCATRRICPMVAIRSQHCSARGVPELSGIYCDGPQLELHRFPLFMRFCGPMSHRRGTSDVAVSASTRILAQDWRRSHELLKPRSSSYLRSTTCAEVFHGSGQDSW